MDNKKIDFDDIQDFIEIMYDRWIKSENIIILRLKLTRNLKNFIFHIDLAQGKSAVRKVKNEIKEVMKLSNEYFDKSEERKTDYREKIRLVSKILLSLLTIR